MEWDTIKMWSPLSIGILLVFGAFIALEREQQEAAWIFAGVGCLLIGSWLTVLLHERFKSDRHDGDSGDD